MSNDFLDDPVDPFHPDYQPPADTARRVRLALVLTSCFLLGWTLCVWWLGGRHEHRASIVILTWCSRVPFLAFLLGLLGCRLFGTLKPQDYWPDLLLIVAVAGAIGHMLWPLN